MFFSSMNKYIVANSVRQLGDWAYQLFHRLNTKKIVMPGESSKFRDKVKIQEMRMEIVQGWISVFLGDYVVGIRMMTMSDDEEWNMKHDIW